MTIPEITAYVMALPVEDVRRLSATDVMGWRKSDCIGASCGYPTHYADDVLATRPPTQLISEWRPDEDRNQSRMVDIRAIDLVGGVDFILAVGAVLKTCLLSGDWLTADGEVQILALLGMTPDQETRAALIAHMIHMQEDEE